MADILTLITEADRLDFSRNFSVARPAYPGDRIFPDQKTEVLKAEYLRIANGATIPVMATVHGFDTEAEIGSRQVFEKASIEKLLIKRKINQTERIRLLRDSGVYSDDAIVRYVFDDMRHMADAVKVRTEVAKMELLSTGRVTVDENNLKFAVDYGVPSRNTRFSLDLGEDADIIGQLQNIIDYAADNGYVISEVMTTNQVLRKMAANKGIQTLIYGTLGQGVFVANTQVQDLLGRILGIVSVSVNDLRYKTQTSEGVEKMHRFFPEGKMVFMAANVNGISNAFGAGLWGVTPEEADYGQYTEKSADQYITLTQWATPDPVAVWTKASGLFIPVLPDPNALFIATEKISK